VIYFIQNTVALAIKIGYSVKPDVRLADLQTASPHKLTLLGTISGTKDHESWLHKRFAKYKLEGEWFDGAILEEVRTIIATHQGGGSPIGSKTATVMNGSMTFLFDTCQVLTESWLLNTPNSVEGFQRLGRITEARLQLLTSRARIVELKVKGLPRSEVRLRGVGGDQFISPRTMIVLRDAGRETKKYLCGVPKEIFAKGRLTTRGRIAFEKYNAILRECGCLITEPSRGPAATVFEVTVDPATSLLGLVIRSGDFTASVGDIVLCRGFKRKHIAYRSLNGRWRVKDVRPDTPSAGLTTVTLLGSFIVSRSTITSMGVIAQKSEQRKVVSQLEPAHDALFSWRKDKKATLRKLIALLGYAEAREFWDNSAP
jgi:hypothetical protein